MDVRAWNGREALIKTAQAVMRRGEEVHPRGLCTKELRHFSLEIQNPYDVLCTGINANQSKEVLAAETLQLIGGFCDPEFAVKHAPNLAAFRNQFGTFDGAYGPRVLLQYPDLVARLNSDEDTRQAVLAIWENSDVMRWGSKDYPCTLTLGFFIRHGRLELDVTMRSNDVNWGLKNDMFQFTQLQLSLANVLGREAGPYRHTSYSMHLYERDWEWADYLIEDGSQEPIPDHPTGIDAESAEDMVNRARMIAKSTVSLATENERWYRRALGWSS